MKRSINNKLSTIINQQLTIGFKFIKKYKQLLIIGFVALPVATIWGLLLCRWIIAPRPAVLQRNSAASSYYYSGSSALYTVKIGDKKTNEPKVEFSLGSNKSVTFSPASARTGLAVPVEKNNTVIFKNVYPNTDYIYKTIPLGVKEDINVHKPNGISVYPFFIETNGVTPKYYTTNLAGGVFYDEKGNYLFNFEKPFATDAKGSRTDKVGITIKKDVKTAKLVALLTVDADWFKDPTRVYPITIDPTVVRNTSAGFAAGQLNRVTDTGSGSSPNLTTNYQELSTDINTVGLWHMNESSGNALDSSGNSNAATTYGATVTTGVLGNARAFSGSTQYLETAASGSLNLTNAGTIELWAYKTANTNYQMYVTKGHTTEYALMDYGTTGQLVLRWGNDTNDLITDDAIPLNTWTHIAAVYDGGALYIYLNGRLSKSVAYTTNAVANTTPLRIGARDDGYYFTGSLDEIRISNIARTPEEIKLDAQRRPYSVYTSDAIDLTYASSWNSLSWTELGVATGDGETPYSTTNLIAQWNFNETSGTNATSSAGTCTSACNGTLTNFASTASQDQAAGTGWTAANKRWGAGALMFNGSNNYVSVTANSALDLTADATWEGWFYFSKNNATQSLIQKDNANGYSMYLSSTGKLGLYINPTGVNGNSTVLPGQWYYLAVTKSGTTATFYVNGVSDGSGTVPSTIPTNAVNLGIGAKVTGPTDYLQGVVDSARIYSRALSASEILSNYQAGNVELQTRVGTSTNADDGTWEAWKPVTGETVIDSMDNPLDWATPSATLYSSVPIATSSSTVVKAEGSGALKMVTGAPKVDTNTVALWHLDETGGTGAYLKDATANANNGTPTGTTVVDGFYGKARSFAGSGNYLTISDTVSLNPTNISIESWVKTSTSGVQQGIIYKYNPSSPWQGYSIIINSSNQAGCWVGGTAWTYNTVTVTDGKWHHVACTYNGTSVIVYVDGVAGTPQAQTANLTYAINLIIGSNATTGNLTGSLDEVRISSTARSAEEIAEAYRAGRGHYINKTISATDLYGKTSLPFYVASDRQGTFLSATIGKSAYANYQTDANTVGLWHLDEATVSGAYIKDSSGNGNNGTPTGTAPVQGKIGKARNFNGSGDNIAINATATNFGTGDFTAGAWIKSSTTGVAQYITSKRTVCGHASFWNMQIGTPNTLQAEVDQDGVGTNYYAATGTTVITDGKWHHVAMVRSGASLSLYVDGKLDFTGSGAGTANISNTATFFIGHGACTGDFNGTLDEVRVDSVARTADQIRQAYEVGARTHNITIDFKAVLNTSNLIANTSDLSFTIDATAYGAGSMGGNLYLGDKIIVRENYSGTEYITQGTVNSVNVSTGAVTVAAWDAGSTVPSGGFTVNATVFKWQREYFDLRGSRCTADTDVACDRYAVTNVTLRVTDGSQGSTVWLDDLRSNSGYLTTPAGSTITSSTGNRYFQYRAIPLSYDPAVSPSITTVTLDYVQNTPPATPSLDSPTNLAANQILLPVLKTTSTDANSDYIRYKIQLCTDSAMTVSCQTFDQTSSQIGWSGQNTQTGTAYTSGTQGVYTLQSALNPATTYYWKSWAIDPGGINTWSSTQTTPYSFTISAVPTPPTLLLTNGLENPVGITTPAPYFSAICNDPDSGDSLVKYRVQVSVDPAFGSTVWDSGSAGASMTTCTAGARSVNITYGGANLVLDESRYYWRIKFWDTAGNEGPFSNSVAFFTMAAATTGMFAPSSCRIQETAADTSLTLVWVINSTGQTQFRIEKNTDGGGFLFLYNAAAGATSYQDLAVSDGHTYQYQVRAEGATNSSYCTTNTLSLQLGTFSIKGLNLKGLNLR